MQLSLSLFLSVSFLPIGYSVDYFVARNGSNENNGKSIRKPFKTIQHAVGQLEAGDTLYLRGGIYHESVIIENISGEDGSPITITNYNAEEVTIDGTKDISEISIGDWTPHSENIYKRTLSEDITQLFVDDKYQIIARWPNANTHPTDKVIRKSGDFKAEEGSWWSKDTWGIAADTSGTSLDGGTIEIDPEYHDLAATNLSFEGGSVILSLIAQGPGNGERKIETHLVGHNTFTHMPLDDSATGKGYARDSMTFIIEHLNALDQAEEWYYEDNTLYLWATEDPSDRNVRGRTLTHAIEFENSNYITMKGINFFASNFRTDWSGLSTNIRIEDCHLSYPDASHRILGDYPYNPDESHYQTSLRGDHNALINSVIEYSEHGAILFKGDGTELRNNLFHHTAIRGIGYTGAIQQVNKFVRNTVYITGSRAVVKTNANPQNNRIQTHNLIDGWGYQQVQHDGAALQCNSAVSTGTVRAYNWMLNADAYGSRWDGHAGWKGVNHHNVGYNIQGAMQIKGDNHDTHHNTCIGGREKNDIIVLSETTENLNSRTYNNLADRISGHRFLPLSSFPIRGDHKANWIGTLHEATSAVDQLRDPAHLDFRPRDGSDLIDAGEEILDPEMAGNVIGLAPDIGAYEYNANEYWIPGRIIPQASVAIPPNGSTNVKLDTDLMWLKGEDAKAHKLYFGTNKFNLIFKEEIEKDRNIFNPGSLISNELYFWRVDTIKSDDSVIVGDIWSFDTFSPPVGGIFHFKPTADTFVNKLQPTKNLGNVGTMRMQHSKRYAFLQFNVTGLSGSITGAEFRVKAASNMKDIIIHGVHSQGEWDESELTWSSSEEIFEVEENELDYKEDIERNSWYHFDVSSFISGDGSYSFRLETTSNSIKQIYSKESNFSPQLYISSDSKHWVVCGTPNGCQNENAAFMNDMNRHEVRCCSDTYIEGWKQKGICDVWANSNLRETNCSSKKTFDEARYMCSIEGGRLCTKAELENGCTRSTGCGFNSELVWSGTSEEAIQ